MVHLSKNLAVETADTSEHEMTPARIDGSSRRDRSFSGDRRTLSILHDLRNPLSTISGSAELLATGTLSPEQTRRVVANIRRASDQMKDLLHDLGFPEKRHNECLEMTNLRGLLCASSEGAGVSRRPDIVVIINVPPEIHLSIDRRRMERVFQNLIGNALEAMPCCGAIYIEASTTPHGVQVTVEDTGPGIPAAIRDSLFQPFVTAEKPDGMGLGLAISRQTVRQHGGDLWSEPSRGARFVIWLPRSGKPECQLQS